jgi:hypothetical protein
MHKIIQFIKNNIGSYNEIHISYELSKEVEKLIEFEPIEKSFDQDIIGDYNFGYINIGKKYPIFSNITFEYDDIEFKNNIENE